MERKSPKFYVADGIVLRMREAIAYVINHVEGYDSLQQRRVNRLVDTTAWALDDLCTCKVITREEYTELRKKLRDLLEKDEKERTSK